MYGMKEKGFYVPQYGKNHGKYFGRWRAKQIDPDFIFFVQVTSKLSVPLSSSREIILHKVSRLKNSGTNRAGVFSEF